MDEHTGVITVRILDSHDAGNVLVETASGVRLAVRASDIASPAAPPPPAPPVVEPAAAEEGPAAAPRAATGKRHHG